MLNRLPVEINPFRYVEQRRQLRGVVYVREMQRLAALALETTGEFLVDLSFAVSETHLPRVTGHIQGQVILECQRCLQPLTFTLEHSLALVFTRSESDNRPEEAGYESWVVDEETLFLRDLVEDELLLALPLIPRHDDCQPLRPLIEGRWEDEIVNESVTTESKSDPFAVLKNWKKSE